MKKKMPLSTLIFNKKRPIQTQAISQTSNSLDCKRQKKQEESSENSASDTLQDASDSDDQDIDKLLGPSEKVVKPLQTKESSDIINKLISVSDLMLLAQPKDQKAQEYVTRVVDFVAGKLEESIQMKKRPGLAKDTSVSELMGTLLVDKKHEPGDYDSLLKLVREKKFRRDENTPPSFDNERQMYPSISALIRFICDAIDEYSGDKEVKPLRGFDVYVHDKNKDKGESVYKWVDMGLVVSTNKVNRPDRVDEGRPDYLNMLTVIEAQIGSRNRDSLMNLCAYTWNLLARPYTRRFAWGLRFVQNTALAYVFGKGYVVSSNVMELGCEQGRRDFVRMLAYWSFCSIEQMGFDPSVRYIEEINRHEIDIYDDETKQISTLFINGRSQIIGDPFCRHTVCLYCVEDQENLGTEDFSKLVFVKNAWNRKEDPNDKQHKRSKEVEVLHKINRVLGQREDLRGTYPELVAAGTVHIKPTDLVINSEDAKKNDDDDDDGLVKDTTVEVLKDLNLDYYDLVTHRVHNRIAMKPCAYRISELESIDELIVVAADVMLVHTAIYTECNILHRDISSNNVMFTRQQDGTVRGVLIDYDMAADVDELLAKKKSEGVGTSPFQSVGNLECSYTPITALDDWESMLYLLCICGTLEIGFENRSNSGSSDDGTLPMDEWKEDSSKTCRDIADKKRWHMDSAGNFKGYVTDHFLDKQGIGHLKQLVSEIHRVLFDNDRFSLMCRGALKVGSRRGTWYKLDKARKQIEESDGSSDKPALFDQNLEFCKYEDPFERRAKLVNIFVEQLNEVMQDARKQALARISALNESEK